MLAKDCEENYRRRKEEEGIGLANVQASRLCILYFVRNHICVHRKANTIKRGWGDYDDLVAQVLRDNHKKYS